VFTYNFLGMERARWKARTRSAPANIPSCLTSNTTAPLRQRWNGDLKVDDKEVANQRSRTTIPAS